MDRRPNISTFRHYYYKWRALRNVPFRKKFFVGFDLDGNTFWEFYSDLNPGRMRRLVELRRSIPSYVDYKMPPQWNQWLRAVRPDPPTMEELMAEEQRLNTLSRRVAAADARWKSIPLRNAAEPAQPVTAGPPEAKPVEAPARAETTKDVHGSLGGQFEHEEWRSKPVRR
ncbi:uncharacterized protein V1510DRAFT_402542 [Dipodascopsis tothii]|uniref:uncharacterized protein n=1 Tax=Dipodascopsis tothii TaxID=44089 RepID=UPI0034CED1E1